jgi:hypothetical protein
MSLEKQLLDETKSKVSIFKKECINLYKWMHSQPICISKYKPFMEEVNQWINLLDESIEKDYKILSYKLDKKKEI